MHLFFDPEEQLADLFETVVQQKLDITPGTRTRKDVTDGTDLRVDFVYDEAQPEPLALEVTSIPLSELLAAHSAGDRWSRSLDETVKAEELGRWVVHFSAHSNIREQSDRIVDVLRSSPNEDIVRDPDDKFTLMRRQPEEGEAHGIYFMGVSTNAFSMTGFSNQLRGVALSNAQKLEETRPRQSHLIVHAGMHLSRDPANTLVPPSPDQVPPMASIDWVWVTFLTQPEDSAREWLWWARPGDDEWNTHAGNL